MIFGFLLNMENTIAIYSYSTPWARVPQKWCVAPEFFVLISYHCNTRIWRMRYGGSWSIYFLVVYILCIVYCDMMWTYKTSFLFAPHDSTKVSQQSTAIQLLPAFAKNHWEFWLITHLCPFSNSKYSTYIKHKVWLC